MITNKILKLNIVSESIKVIVSHRQACRSPNSASKQAFRVGQNGVHYTAGCPLKHDTPQNFLSMKYSIHLKYSKCQTISIANLWHLENFWCNEYFILRKFFGVSSFSGHPVDNRRGHRDHLLGKMHTKEGVCLG